MFSPETPTSAVLVSCNAPEYLNIALDLLDAAKTSKVRPLAVILDPLGRHNYFVAPSIGPIKFCNPVEQFVEICRQRGYDVRYMTSTLFEKRSLDPELSKVLASEETRLSIDATLSFLFMTEYLSNPRLLLKRHKLKKSCKALVTELWRLLEQEPSITEFSIPNGRFHDQSVIAQVCQIKGLKIIWYEKGLQEGHYYTGPTNLLDRHAMSGLLEVADPNESDKRRAENWFVRRMQDVKTNVYLQNSSADTSLFFRPFLSIFTSSPDEFHLLNSDWREATWTNQYEAILQIIEFTAPFSDVIVRAHPNMVNKGLRDRLRLLKFCFDIRRRFPQVLVLSPSSHVDSYSLLTGNCWGVVVWQSTLGLESARLGLPTFIMQSTEYSSLVEVTRLFGPEDLDKLMNVSPPERLSRQALDFISARFSLEKPVVNLDRVNMDHWPRWRVRMGRLLVLPFHRKVLGVLSFVTAVKYRPVRALATQMRELVVWARFPIRTFGRKGLKLQ